MMKNQTAPDKRAMEGTARPAIVRPEVQFDRLRELREAIAGRAYEIFEGRGREHGHEFADWLRAESEVLRHIPIKMSESEDALRVQAEMPGFDPREVIVSVGPRQLIISGNAGQADDREAENTFSREILAGAAFRLLELPVEVDAEKAQATLVGGILTVKLPKPAAGEPARAQASAV
jgi:HSP20 family molecular chaperone IbpA